MTSRWWFHPALAVLSLPLVPIMLFVFAAIVTYPMLPSLESLTDYHPKIPLRIYSAEGILIGEFGEERRELVHISEVPALLKQAILAAEDDRFYEHGGVDYIGVLRAAYSNFTSGGLKQGASTITMQVARNFFLSREKTLARKFNEMLLAFKIEHNLSKDEILQLYVNHIYLGQRAYGFAAAARVYYGKTLGTLTLSEMAMLAGLPKAPATFNPVANPERARVRQVYVLRRMHDLGFITREQLDLALNEPLEIKPITHRQSFPVDAAYVAEMVRQEMYERFQEAAYTEGYSVYTTIRARDQAAAHAALRKGVLEYERRHGYRGPEGYVDLKRNNTEELLSKALQDVPDSDDLIPAVVLSIHPKGLRAYCKTGEIAEVRGEGLRLAQQTPDNRSALNRRLRPGSLIRVRKHKEGYWEITQLPQVEAAFVSANPRNGAIYALVGGFDFARNQFNHVTQAWRQPGSSFKPFIYSAALEKGFTPASVINDAPLVLDLSQTGEELWQPKNFDGEFDGPMRLRQGLTRSKNLVSIRILQAIGVDYAQDYVTKFGFEKEKIGPYLTMALGAGSVTPLQLMAGYAVFANGGYRVHPYLIERIVDSTGNVIFQASPVVAGENAERIIDVRNAFIMVDMMQDVVRHGTAMKAMELGRRDLAGKTGTTSDSMDAWFAGFHPTLVAVTWIGYDTPQSLGERETGGGAALPIWMDYMGQLLDGIPEIEYTRPEGVLMERINDQGLRDPDGTITEYFYEENLPPAQGEAVPDENKPSDTIDDQLF